MGCGKEITVYVLCGYSYKPFSMKCGQTGVSGYPEFCPDCECKYKDVDWKKEARENGENWDEDEAY